MKNHLFSSFILLILLLESSLALDSQEMSFYEKALQNISTRLQNSFNNSKSKQERMGILDKKKQNKPLASDSTQSSKPVRSSPSEPLSELAEVIKKLVPSLSKGFKPEVCGIDSENQDPAATLIEKSLISKNNQDRSLEAIKTKSPSHLAAMIEKAKCFFENNKSKFENQENFLINDLTSPAGSEARAFLISSSGEILKTYKTFDGGGKGNPNPEDNGANITVRNVGKSNLTPAGFLCTRHAEKTDNVPWGIRIMGLEPGINDISDKRGIKLHTAEHPTHGCIGIGNGQADELIEDVRLKNPSRDGCGTLIYNHIEGHDEETNSSCKLNLI